MTRLSIVRGVEPSMTYHSWKWDTLYKASPVCMASKGIYPKCLKHRTSTMAPRIDCRCLVYFAKEKHNLLPTLTNFSLWCKSTFRCRPYKGVTETLVLYSFSPWIIKNLSSNIGCFSKTSEIFSTALTAKSAPKQKGTAKWMQERSIFFSFSPKQYDGLFYHSCVL